MERKSIVLLLACALTASFFFPLFNWDSFEMSGPNFILSDHTPPFKYLLSLIPLISIVLFLRTYYKERFVFSRRLISWLPLTVLIVVFIAGAIQTGFSNLVMHTAIGFWMTLLFSLALAFVLNKGHKVIQEDY
jgi:hypothetical protein